MRRPDGRNYANQIVVTEIDPTKRIVLHHVSGPRYLLTVTLEPTADGRTLVSRDQDFENPDVGRRVEPVVVQANEGVLDRLSAEVLRHHRGD
jgi:uncharacterized protein YndB with AHSA1/START domain